MGAMTDQHDFPEVSTVWLRVFLEVARQGSFTGAARTLGWTQSAVSRQISTLEGALGGAPLFDRLPRGVRLTEAGRVLVPYAETVGESLHGAVRELAALREVAGGRLRFGAFATADAGLVPRALADFRARHPRVHVTREEGFTPVLLDRLSAGHLDLAVVSTTGSAPLEAYALHHLLDESLYVAAGLGVALVPALAAASVRPDVRLVPVLDEGGPARAVYAATARGRSLPPAVREFLNVLGEAAVKMSGAMA